jgi:hypothetical protein
MRPKESEVTATNIHDRAVQVRCPVCGAQKGEECNRSSGTFEDTGAHLSRIAGAFDALRWVA